MSLSNLKPVVCQIPPVTGANGSHSNVSNINMVNSQAQALPPLQAKKTDSPLLQESLSSRRDMIMKSTAASIGLLSLLLPASAQARPRNATMRQKIMEKFQQLREKAGFGKPKDEDEDKKLETKNETEENKMMMKDVEEKKPVNEEVIVPSLPNILNGNTVETDFP